MQLTGIEVPFEALSKIESNTVMMVISDGQGKVQAVKIDHQSIPEGESLLRVISSTCGEEQPQGGCWVRTNGGIVWMNPCPY